MDGQELDCSAAWASNFLSGSDSGGGSRIDGAAIGFSVAPGDAEVPEPLGTSPSLLLTGYPACYSLSGTAGDSAAQSVPTAGSCVPGQTTGNNATAKEEAWYESGDALPAATVGSEASPSTECPARPLRLRCHSTPITLRWLRDNYELRDGVCIPRSVIYQHYTICCFENGIAPVNAASFGKIVRHQYPSLTTRRLGTRGKSRYYYYGLAVAPTSRFYHPVYSEKHTSVKLKKNYSTNCSFEKERSGRLPAALPELPSLSRLAWHEPGVPRAARHRFDTLYRTHCQSLLDLVTAGRFEQVRDSLVQFWNGMPQQVRSLLHHDVVVQVVGACDGLLYHAMAEALIPNELEASAELAIQAAGFGEQLRGWLVTVLAQTPPRLQAVKLDCCCELQRLLQRLPQLVGAQRAGGRLLGDQQARARLLASWRAVDLYEVTQFTLRSAPHADFYCITNAASEFEGILQMDSGVTSLLRFVDRLLARLFSSETAGGVDTGSVQSLEHRARWTLLTWDTFCGELLRRMPQNGAGGGLYSWLTEYLQYRLQLICTRRAATSRLAGLTSVEYSGTGGSSGSDNSYAGSDDSSAQRSPPTSDGSSEFPGCCPGQPPLPLPGTLVPAASCQPTQWPKQLKQDDSF